MVTCIKNRALQQTKNRSTLPYGNCKNKIRVKRKNREQVLKSDSLESESSFCTSWTTLFGKLALLSLGFLARTLTAGGPFLRALQEALD